MTAYIGQSLELTAMAVFTIIELAVVFMFLLGFVGLIKRLVQEV